MLVERGMIRTGKIIGLMVTISTVVGAAAVALMMVQIIMDVVLRNLFGIAIPGTTTSVTNYYMVIVAYLPLALAERMDSHIAVEVVARLLNQRLRQWLIAFTWALSALVTAVVTYALWGEAMKAYSYGSFVIEFNTPIPIWPGYFALPVGFGLYSLVLIYRLACAATGSDSDAGLGPRLSEEDAPVAGEV
jgi:TRAP-type C4-dicarboxylate transport system permease small subunit